MILYECTECGFGIGGSEPDDADDAYELAQEIQAHEEVHRNADDQSIDAELADALPPHPAALTPADASELLREQAKKGAVILPERPEPLTRADVRAIVREELARARSFTEVTPEVLEAVAHAALVAEIDATTVLILREWAGQMRGEAAEPSWATWQEVPVGVRVTSNDIGRYDTLEKTSDGTVLHRFASGTECCRSLTDNDFVGSAFVAPFMRAEGRP